MAIDMKEVTKTVRHRYEGTWYDKDDNVIEMPEGTEFKRTYFGDMTDDVEDGVGTYDIPSREGRFVGEFTNNKREGFGVKKMDGWAMNEILDINEYVDDKQHGMGIRVYKNGSKYIGEFTDDVATGFGMFFTADGEKYVGRVVRDLPTGEGEWFDEDDRPIERGTGVKVSLSSEDEGTIDYVNGDHYKGAILNGKPHGQGEFVHYNGTTLWGTFVNGEPTKGLAKYPSGNQYEGQYGIHENRFVIFYKDGSKLVRDCKDKGSDLGYKSQPCGYGVYTLVDGSAFEGEWFPGDQTAEAVAIYGEGVWTDHKGDRYTGEFVNGIQLEKLQDRKAQENTPEVST